MVIPLEKRLKSDMIRKIAIFASKACYRLRNFQEG